MRVVAGRWRGRTLRAPRGVAVRPTTDRVRESIFAILGERVVGTILRTDIPPELGLSRGDVERLCAIEGEGVAGAILGRALYEGKLDFRVAQARADELNG